MDQKRYQHSLYVSHEAIRLAKRYGASVHLAQTAGLLHDICKQMPTEEQLQWVLKSDIIWDTTTLKQQHLLHGMAAAEYIQSQLGIYQRDVVHAVRYHTIGRPNMSLLEKIIFVADLTSAERDYPDVETTRMLANQSLDAAVAYIMRHTIGMLVKKQLPISHNTRDTYNYYATSTTHT